jgi:hypothetical protein
MFNSISWQGYWIFLAILLAGYYLVIYLLYFRSDFSIKPAGNRRLWTPVEQGGAGQSSLFPSAAAAGTPEVDLLASACVDELGAYFREASRSKTTKEELLFALTQLLSKYPSLPLSEYIVSINNLIRSEAEHHCSIHISSEEVVSVWLGL